MRSSAQFLNIASGPWLKVFLKISPPDERGRLKVLLTSWVEHNKQDSEKFRKWAEKAKDAESDSVYHGILQAARDMEKANDKLSRLLIELYRRG